MRTIDNQPKKVRRFDRYTSKEDAPNIYNGIHPGKPMNGYDAHEMRFDLLINDLMPEEVSNYKNVSQNYNWRRDSKRITLKEF